MTPSPLPAQPAPVDELTQPNPTPSAAAAASFALPAVARPEARKSGPPSPLRWSLLRCAGARADVRARILAAADLPEAARAFLVAQVDALPGEAYGVTLSAYSQTHRTTGTALHVHVAATVVAQLPG